MKSLVVLLLVSARDGSGVNAAVHTIYPISHRPTLRRREIPHRIAILGTAANETFEAVCLGMADGRFGESGRTAQYRGELRERHRFADRVRKPTRTVADGIPTRSVGTR
jgi:hypothetical protein